MSSAGQIIGGVVGAIAGFFMGGPAGALYGAQIGMGIGGYIDPPKGPNLYGPRLTDLSVQSSTYGAVIPRLYGTCTVYGNVFWIENNSLKEVSHTEDNEGGKGGGDSGTTTTYSYFGTFAVGLCKGPIAGVRRIWIGSELWYDAGSDNLSTIVASNKNSNLFTLYTGSDTQQPDSRMQATLGVANTPAYRGLAYIVFKDLPLAEYSNSIQGAQVKVEVFNSGSMNLALIAGSLPAGGSRWTEIAFNGQVFCSLGTGNGVSAVSYDGVNWTRQFIGYADLWWDTLISNGSVFCATGLWGRVGVSSDGRSWRFGSIESRHWLNMAWNGSIYCAVAHEGYSAVSHDGLNWRCTRFSPDAVYWRDIAYGDGLFCAVSHTSMCATSKDGINWTFHAMSKYDWQCVKHNGSVWLAVTATSAGGYTVSATSIDGSNWVMQTKLPSKPYAKLFVHAGVFYALAPDLICKSTDGVNWTIIYQTFGFNAVNAVIIADNYMVLIAINGACCKIYIDSMINTNLLSSVLNKECELCALSQSDIDTSLITQEVKGYKIGKLSSIRSAIEPLRAAYAFDVIQKGYKIQFKPRNSASVATVEAKDLAAIKGGSE